ncbi:protein LAZY 1-like [Cucurbita pepo subsp. pepo]|uniref:protein LAZY 1-like n=1 Tax=Cucurbita pepo subsp. pepo TaxID=3664 RepID=UPI000C9D7353|nr:protein LAZY 1-like [Cucurbita pepo subsp. pepo]
MKLLGWMHRKLRQNGGEPFKDYAIGQQSVDDQQYISKSSIKPFKQAQREQQLRKSFAGLESEVGDEDYEDESSHQLSEIFHGFLAIGTLGCDQVINDPMTPKFSISVENITEKETEVTENELKLINDELEKVLGAETKDEGYNDSSGRNSHVSMGRSSHGSTITLSGKPMDGLESNMSGSIICPLQGYLFGSAIELSETTAVAKKENRTSLGELFQRSKIAEENAGPKFDKEDKRAEEDIDKSAMHLMKKKLKKRMLSASSRSSAAAVEGLNDSASAETKLHKIFHMFHRKVHPESSAIIQKSDKHQKVQKKKKAIHNHDGCCNNGEQTSDEDIMIYPQRTLSKPSFRCIKNQFPPHYGLNSSDPNDNKERWINSDEDYLVLEL